MDNSTRRQLLDRARSAGFPGSILDVYSAYDQGRDLIQEFVQQQQMPQMQVAQTPQEQEQGLRPAHQAGQVDQSMAFPNVQPGQSFNTVGMKVPINIDKIDNQGNLVESYKAVPPGIQNLPTGPYEGTVIESPAKMKTGGVNKHQTGDFKTPPANLPWLGTKGQVLTEEEQEEKLLDKKFGIGPTVDKAKAIKDKETIQKTKRIETPLPSGAITPTMGPVEFALMAPVAGASALRAAPIIGSALNTSIAGVQGLTVGNALGAGFASDAIVNRFPQIPVQLAKGEYSNAAVNAITGIGDLAGANMISPFLKGARFAVNETPLPKGFKGTSSFVKQIKGELKQGKLNREAIKEGNEWLEAWVKHPETQRKINTDLNKQIKTEELLYADAEDRVKALNLMKEQSKNFKPNVKEYPLLKQLDENFQQYLSNKARKSIHQGNLGVSYQHGQTPEYRKLIEEGSEKPFSRYGSWVSRDTKLDQRRRTTTAIHEGTHDWVSEKAFAKSGMRDLVLKNMNPGIKEDFLEWEKYRDLGVDPVKEMGKERAYQAYLADPTEQHARIMELRYELGIGQDPSYRMNEEIAEGVMKWIDQGKSTVDPKFLKVIDNDPKKFAELFNKFWGVAPVAIGAAAAKEKKQMGGSYETNQEVASYEWRTGRPEESRKRYIKGGLKNRVLYNKAKYKR